MGGLGNQLFQIATGYAHARRHGYQLQLPPTTNCKRGTYWDTFYPACKQFRTHAPNGAPRYSEQHFHYSQIPSTARNLIGYFQSSKYFAEYECEIRDLFVPSEAVRATMNHKWGHLLTEPRIVVHIRRGDYVNLPEFHCILTPSYYVSTVNRMIAETGIDRVLVFSDDIEWCKTIGLPASSLFVDEPDEAVSLHLMSQFQHYVISNSSFSWWAVWLGKKASLVYVPDEWFGTMGPTDIQDIYEPDWVKLPIK